jgi:hypothetical protein
MTFEHGDARPFRRGNDVSPFPGALEKRFAGPDDAVGAVEVRDDLAAPPDVVAERDRVDAAPRAAVGELRRDAHAVRDVLAVRDAEVDVELVASEAKALLDRLAARRADDVGDEEKPQLAAERRGGVDLRCPRGSPSRSCIARATAARRR